MNDDFDSELEEQQETKIKKPKMFNVVLLNDDFTPMDFVIEVLVKVFNHSTQKAYQITMDIHEKGEGVCGTYTKTIAEAKSKKTNDLAKQREFVLESVVKEA